MNFNDPSAVERFEKVIEKRYIANPTYLQKLNLKFYKNDICHEVNHDDVLHYIKEIIENLNKARNLNLSNYALARLNNKFNDVVREDSVSEGGAAEDIASIKYFESLVVFNDLLSLELLKDVKHSSCSEKSIKWGCMVGAVIVCIAYSYHYLG